MIHLTAKMISEQPELHQEIHINITTPIGAFYFVEIEDCLWQL